MPPEGTSKFGCRRVRPTLVRKVNADDKRQAAELIELYGGDLRREPLDSGAAERATARVLLSWLDRDCRVALVVAVKDTGDPGQPNHRIVDEEINFSVRAGRERCRE